ncbi:MAG: hypothetical protein J5702_02240 [Bacteroidales bacterium]|nr:hypothetical protein [Bacteroidales bacterium]
MKKIIYSLVIMIAAGSLFTSCIEQVEPEGIKNLRDAKAEYIRALKDLRAADAEFQRASAEVQRAEAALRQAQADACKAQTECYVQMQALERELKELEIAGKALELEARAAEIAAEIEGIELTMEEIRKAHEINMVELEEELAEAQESLRKTLRDIALASQDLTANEKAAVKAAIDEYEAAYKAYVNQTIVVMKAEQAVAEAQKNLAKADLVWDKESLEYVNKVDLWEKKIEQAKQAIAEDEALLEDVPDPDLPDLNEWQATLDNLEKSIADAKYSKHTLTEEAAAYYVTYVHDNRDVFDDFIDAWVEENPAVAEPTKVNEPKQEDYTIDTKKTMVKIPAFDADMVADPDKALIYQRFADLVGEYTKLASDAKKDKKIAEVTTEGDIATVNVYTLTELHDFIMGNTEGKPNYATYKDANGNDVKNAKSAYGINGAISVLERELVLAEQSKEAEKEAIEKKYKELDSTWRAQREILLGGLANWDVYKQAQADSIAAEEALAAAKEAAKDGGKNMVAAIKELQAALASVNSAGVSYNDSVRIINAYVAFAQAREDYLIYECTTEKNFDYYRFWNTTKAKIDSVKFTELTYEALAADTYGYSYVSHGKWSTKNWGLAHIAIELLNSTFSTPMRTSDGNWDFSSANFNMPMTDGHNAFYGLYDYDEPNERMVMHGTSDPITTKAEKEAEAELAKAKLAIVLVKLAYSQIYREYWNNDTFWYGDPENNAGCYNENTFLQPYNIVYFVGDEIVYNDGLGTILAFIDPAVGGASVNPWDLRDSNNKLVKTSDIFGGDNDTDYDGNPDLSTFGKMLQAKQAYDTFGSLTPWKEALEEIKAWRDKVEAAFQDLIAKDGQPDTAAYNAAKKAYDKYVADKAKFDAYIAKLVEFVGADDKGKPIVNDPKTLKINKAYKDVASISDPWGFKNVDVENGVWALEPNYKKKIGGAVKAKLDELFPEFPAKLKVWKDAEDNIDDVIAHYQLQIDALTPAYLAAAQAVGYDKEFDPEGKGWDELIKNYNAARAAYIKALEDDIDDQNETIAKLTKKIADFESGVPAAELELAEAEAKLAKATFKLEQLADRLAGAEANLQAILEYIGSLDSNIVTPVTD